MEISGDNLREARKKVGLTQENLADATEFSPRQIGRFERNENLIKLKKYFKLYETLFPHDDKDKK